MKKLVNFLGFQAGWWSCVLGAADGNWWIGPSVVAAVLALHLALNGNRRGEIALMLFAGLLGLLFDGTLASNGLLRFPEYAGPSVGPLPLWMLALWVNMAPTLGSALGWMRRRFVLGGLFGLIGGPLTYYAGVNFGALQFAPDNIESFAALALTWTLAMLALQVATERCLPADEESAPEEPAPAATADVA